MIHERLKEALQGLTPSGPRGFEGLVAALLGRLLNEQFIVARSGDQPGGDARSLGGQVSMQAKRYGDSTTPSATNIEGDIRRALRESSRLDTYVLAITRAVTSQLQSTLDSIKDETGLDIVTLAYGPADPELETLCLAYWDTASEFPSLQALTNDVSGHMAQSGNRSVVDARLAQIRRSVAQCVDTHGQVAQQAGAFLQWRFGLEDESPSRFGYRIELGSAVARSAIQQRLRSWWAEEGRRVGRLEGEEGNGKSWAAARFAIDMAEEEHAVVLWVDSAHWAEAPSLQEAVEAGLRNIGILDAKKLARIAKKALHRWRQPVLLVLDGANERGAIIAAKRLLEDYFIPQREVEHLAVLLTTRPLESYPAYEASLWQGCTKIAVGPFDDDEFEAALKSLPDRLTPADVPDALQDIARIPRYFHTCIRLRDRLRGFGQVTKELVLWMDLLQRIEDTDHQVRCELGWRSKGDAEQVLRELARNAEQTVDGSRASASCSLLNRCFAGQGYEGVRHQLMELRITESHGPLLADLSQHHVVLGWALYILEMVRSGAPSTVREAVDDIHRILEPISTEDCRTEALFLALQMSALFPHKLGDNTQARRASLLLAWLLSNNAAQIGDRLTFWADEDTQAYLEFIEAFYEELYAGNDQTMVVEPLARKWLASNSPADCVSAAVRRWLLLARPEASDSGQSEYRLEGHALPVAANDQQLRLSAVALSLLSLRPDPGFLPTLALSRATLNVSERQDGEQRRSPKSLEKNFGFLMRWRYTESVLPQLMELLADHRSDPLVSKGLAQLAQALWPVQTPAEFEGLIELPQWQWDHRRPVDVIRDGLTLFPGKDAEHRPTSLHINGLAVMPDLPNPIESDQDRVKQEIERLCASGRPHWTFMHSKDDEGLERYWAWYARLWPQEFPMRVQELLLKALGYQKPQYLLGFLMGSVAEVDAAAAANIVQMIRERGSAWAESEDCQPMHPWLMNEVMLWVAPETDLVEWFLFVGASDALRKYARMDATPWILRHAAPSRLVSEAWQRVQELATTSSGSEDKHYVSEFGFWLMILACGAKPGHPAYKWAEKQLKRHDLLKCETFELWAVLAATGPAQWLESILSDRNLRSKVDRDAVIAFERTGREWPESIRLDASYEDLMHALPQDLACWVFRLGGRDADFRRWGNDLLDFVITLTSNPPFELRSRGYAALTLNGQGLIEYAGQRRSNESEAVGSALPSSWGVDYGDMEKMMQRFMRGEGERDSDFEEWLREWRRFEKWRHYPIHMFSADLCLQEWADKYTEDFLGKAYPFLEGVCAAPGSSFHLGAVVYSVLRVLLEHDPEAAVRYFEKLSPSRLRTEVRTYYQVPTFHDRLWDTNRCDSAEHRSLRRRLLGGAGSDKEILMHASAALANQAGDELWRICGELLSRPQARERCLAVSLLPWLASDEAVSRLSSLTQDDPSGWVRDHAGWARDVALQEKGCRQLYGEALAAADPAKACLLLQQMRPALTPTCRWWRDQVQEETANETNTAPRRRALIWSFWYHWDKWLRSSTTVFDRKLEQYCRGEKLDPFISPRMAPWWKVN